MNESPFNKCTTTTIDGDRCTIQCNLGLWSIDGPRSFETRNEAMHYFGQYLADGEYDLLLEITK